MRHDTTGCDRPRKEDSPPPLRGLPKGKYDKGFGKGRLVELLEEKIDEFDYD